MVRLFFRSIRSYGCLVYDSLSYWMHVPHLESRSWNRLVDPARWDFGHCPICSGRRSHFSTVETRVARSPLLVETAKRRQSILRDCVGRGKRSSSSTLSSSSWLIRTLPTQRSKLATLNIKCGFNSWIKKEKKPPCVVQLCCTTTTTTTTIKTTTITTTYRMFGLVESEVCKVQGSVVCYLNLITPIRNCTSVNVCGPFRPVK